VTSLTTLYLTISQKSYNSSEQVTGVSFAESKWNFTNGSTSFVSSVISCSRTALIWPWDVPVSRSNVRTLSNVTARTQAANMTPCMSVSQRYQPFILSSPSSPSSSLYTYLLWRWRYSLVIDNINISVRHQYTILYHISCLNINLFDMSLCPIAVLEGKILHLYTVIQVTKK